MYYSLNAHSVNTPQITEEIQDSKQREYSNSRQCQALCSRKAQANVNPDHNIFYSVFAAKEARTEC